MKKVFEEPKIEVVEIESDILTIVETSFDPVTR